MTELEQYLVSMEPDMMNVTRLFGIADAAWEEPRRFAWSAWEEDGCYRCRVSGDGREAEGSAAIPMDGDAQLRALHRKRAVRIGLGDMFKLQDRFRHSICPPFRSRISAPNAAA